MGGGGGGGGVFGPRIECKLSHSPPMYKKSDAIMRFFHVLVSSLARVARERERAVVRDMWKKKKSASPVLSFFFVGAFR